MEHVIGDCFRYKDKTLEVVEGEKDSCCGCYFMFWCDSYSKEVTGICSRTSRTDRKDVIFKKV